MQPRFVCIRTVFTFKSLGVHANLSDLNVVRIFGTRKPPTIILVQYLPFYFVWFFVPYKIKEIACNQLDTSFLRHVRHRSRINQLRNSLA